MRDSSDVTILLVEDDPGHARLIERNLRRNGTKNEIIHVDNGQKAIDFLFNEEEKLPAQLLAILDLNLPVLNGYQVLKRIKESETLRHIPVIVLTTTDDQREVQKCYDLGCNVYVAKPIDYANFTDAIAKIGQFLSVVQVPSSPR